ncbi:fungal-specific transcription factor domain-containing protein [Lasiosphaeria hispida]|uniref:Fungal-specific transcription factor domain-containing protein n=1 Tax=Lasiosphaeria hispida TaxID=260671 RepID=A0AAJ0H873_9PEZI|nr:fungal-specific transcription factor domain-containing protein [Lasiosphaeria hispida]
MDALTLSGLSMDLTVGVGNRRRRPRYDHAVQQDEDAEFLDFLESLEEQNTWGDMTIYAVDADNVPRNPAKRRHGDVSWLQEPSPSLAPQSDSNAEWDAFLATHFPEHCPSVPDPATREVDLDVSNPFVDDSIQHYTFQDRLSFEIPEDGAINGYIKIRFQNVHSSPEDRRPTNREYNQQTLGVHHRDVPGVHDERVPPLPPHFGLSSKLDEEDGRLLKFYTDAFCAGRTLIKISNFWLSEVTAIADMEECVRHALLASTAAYVLDYVRSEKMRIRANMHYRRAADLLTRALRNPACRQVGKEAGVTAAILLLLCDDIVNWETRKPKDKSPKWHKGSRLAVNMLDNSDPGYRYWKPANVQSDNSRISLSNRIAFVDVLAQPVSPLANLRGQGTSSRQYGWLLEGAPHDVLKIQGGTGLCSKLLHIFAQITQLSSRLAENPDSDVIPKGAAKIEQKLANLTQWFRCSEVPRRSKIDADLWRSCNLDQNGKVATVEEVTELTGEAWRIAAQIYLQCRFFRKPRDHPDVVERLSALLRCIEYMPYTGPLFSSQAPFFPVFLTGLVGYLPEHRRVTEGWFNVVIGGASCRSSVPPIWGVVQNTWKWTDEELHVEPFDGNTKVGFRDPWWEKLVARLFETEGLLSLC